MKRKPNNYIALDFLSRSVNEGFARTAVAAFAAQMDPTLDELGDVKTAVSEAVTNAIVHGYRDTVGEIQLILKLYADRTFSAEVRDRGVGIRDVEEAMRPLFTTDPEHERSGMGFTIIENFTDSLRVVSSPGKGTRVIMKKKLSMLPISK